MLKILLIFIISLGACSFDPGLAPKGPVDKDTAADSDTTKKDTGRDGGSKVDTSKDLAGGDFGRDTAKDFSTDSSVDMPKADVSEDMGTFCDGEPVDLMSDSAHCGECNHQCDPNFSRCDQAKCVCPENAEPCGLDNTCKDTKNDPQNCGGCGVTCGLAAECVNSTCVCREGYTDCNGKCVNLESDPLNCGRCENECGGRNDACRNGDCERNCTGGGWNCDVSGDLEYCATRPDIYTCNARVTEVCGTECGVGETCVKNSGASITYRCRTNRPTIACQSCPCVECSEDEDCTVSAYNGNEVFCVEK